MAVTPAATIALALMGIVIFCCIFGFYMYRLYIWAKAGQQAFREQQKELEEANRTVDEELETVVSSTVPVSTLPPPSVHPASVA